MLEAVLLVRIPDLWVTPVSEKYDVTIRCEVGGPQLRGGWCVITMVGDEENLDRALEETKGHPSVGKLEVRHREEGSVTFVIDVARCKACRELLNSRSFLIFPFSVHEGYMEWVLVTDGNRTLGKVCRNLEKLGCDIKINKTSNLEKREVLTKRQMEIVRTAFSNGYFDYPRRINGTSLASKFGITNATLSEIIRAAQRRILKEYIQK